MPPVVPPAMFATVEDGVYRSCIPGMQNMGFIETLGLRTVVVLGNEPLEDAVTKKLQKAGVGVMELGREYWVPSTKWIGLGEDLVKKALEAVLDTNLHPLLLCCTTGVHITGVTVSCLRKFQGWAITCALEDYRAYADTNNRTSCMHFINQFDTSLITAPPNPPSWYQAQLDHEEGDTHYFSGVHSPEAVNYSSHDPRPAYKAFYFCTMAPSVSGKVCYDENSKRKK
eukprot:TRINITY_DN1031_c0_g3_i1.p1 TRINITY_DN1031_c0_g3~~TRINITY_DN1031_c0_g3_i1.p1  ORF type:complete len:227 (+),score=42.57 TRINITY_DN1031_c0_g3_i1:47-727(+)